MKTLFYSLLTLIGLSACHEREQPIYVDKPSQMEIIENRQYSPHFTILRDKETGHKYLITSQGGIIRLDSAK
jgi:hypothetical protein